MFVSKNHHEMLVIYRTIITLPLPISHYTHPSFQLLSRCPLQVYIPVSNSKSEQTGMNEIKKKKKRNTDLSFVVLDDFLQIGMQSLEGHSATISAIYSFFL